MELTLKKRFQTLFSLVSPRERAKNPPLNREASKLIALVLRHEPNERKDSENDQGTRHSGFSPREYFLLR
jgi:hypothetical protein